MALDTTNSLISLDDAKAALGIAVGDAQVVQVICDTPDSGVSGAYFAISSTYDDYYVWFSVEGGGADPVVTASTGIEVALASGDDAAVVATHTASAVTAITGFTATATGRTVEIINSSTGSVTAASGGTAGLTVTTVVEGADGNPEHDAKLNEIINRVSWRANSETQRQLKARSQTEYYDGCGGIELWLRNWPASGLTLYQDSDRTFASGAIIASGDFVLYEDSGRVVLTGTTFTQDFKIIKAEYTGGYSTIPYDLQQEVIMEVARIFQSYEHKTFIASSRSTDLAGTTSYVVDERSAFKAALQNYTRINVI